MSNFAFLNSASIEMFPAAYRDSTYTKSRQTSEENLTDLRRISDLDENCSYAYMQDNKIYLVIAGYRFNFTLADLQSALGSGVDLTDSGNATSVFAFIKTLDDTVFGRRLVSANAIVDDAVSYEDGDQTAVELLDVGGSFYGLGFTLDSAQVPLDAQASIELEFADGELTNKVLTLDSTNVRDSGSRYALSEQLSTHLVKLDDVNITAQNNVKNDFDADGNSVVVETSSEVHVASGDADLAITGSVSANDISSDAFEITLAHNGQESRKLKIANNVEIDNNNTIKIEGDQHQGTFTLRGEGGIYSTNDLGSSSTADAQSVLLLSDIGADNNRLSVGLSGNALSTQSNVSAQIFYPDADNNDIITSLQLPIDLPYTDSQLLADHKGKKFVWIKEVTTASNAARTVSNKWVDLQSLSEDTVTNILSAQQGVPGTSLSKAAKQAAEVAVEAALESRKPDVTNKIITEIDARFATKVANLKNSITADVNTHMSQRDNEVTRRLNAFNATQNEHKNYVTNMLNQARQSQSKQYAQLRQEFQNYKVDVNADINVKFNTLDAQYEKHEKDVSAELSKKTTSIKNELLNVVSSYITKNTAQVNATNNSANDTLDRIQKLETDVTAAKTAVDKAVNDVGYNISTMTARVNEKIDDIDRAIEAIENKLISSIMNKVYPVGSIVYLNIKENPGVKFGVGTWRKIEGRFLLGATNANSAGVFGKTGGEWTHLLTAEEMPRHRHGQNFGGGSKANLAGKYVINIPPEDRNSVYDIYSSTTSISEGYTVDDASYEKSGYNSILWLRRTQCYQIYTDPIGGRSINAGALIGTANAHNNMPPYQAVYIWERIA